MVLKIVVVNDTDLVTVTLLAFGIAARTVWKIVVVTGTDLVTVTLLVTAVPLW